MPKRTDRLASRTTHKDGWAGLKAFTDARIALGRAGTSIPTAANLQFQLAHAMARDAVHLPLDVSGFLAGLEDFGLPVVEVESRVGDRREYLLRPDLGRRLSGQSVDRLREVSGEGHDLSLVIADGLSTTAIARQAIPFLEEFIGLASGSGFSLAPLVYVHNGRVAIGDEVGEILKARMVAVLVGERPGLSSPDSMGVYLTYAPRVGLTDESRNCISNVRAEGLPHVPAAETLHYLAKEAFRKKLTGVKLKDERMLSSAEATLLAEK